MGPRADAELVAEADPESTRSLDELAIDGDQLGALHYICELHRLYVRWIERYHATPACLGRKLNCGRPESEGEKAIIRIGRAPTLQVTQY